MTTGVGAEEARAHGAGEDEGPPKFTAAFYRHLLTLEVSLDGADGSQLPISIEEEVRDVPRRLRKQAARLAGGDGIAVLLRRTTVWQDGVQVRHLIGQDGTTAMDGADLRVSPRPPETPADLG